MFFVLFIQTDADKNVDIFGYLINLKIAIFYKVLFFLTHNEYSFVPLINFQYMSRRFNRPSSS